MTLFNDEPLEVCILKKQLANLSCKCSVCERHSDSASYKEEYKQNNKVVQAGQFMEPVDQIFGRYDNSYNSKVDTLSNNVSCPGCYIALNLLKAREIKVCKDEETGTNSGLSCCDKSIGKCVKFVEKTTSMSNMNKTALQNSVTSLCGKSTSMAVLNGIMKKRSNEHVTFSDYQNQNESKNELEAFYGHCFCLQNFMDSIRPPLPD